MRKKNFTQLPADNDPKFLGLFTKDKSFYKAFFPLLLIITLQQVSALLVNLVDNVMLGRYTELALSGATLVNQIQFTLQQVSAGIGMGVVVLASQYWGQRRIEPIKKIINIGAKLGLAVGIIFFVAAKLIPFELLSIFSNDVSVITEGMKYLDIMAWTYLIFSVSSCLMYSLQSVETAAIGTVMSVSTIIINACLNYCLIYGNFGFAELGIRGAAFATLTSRIVELLLVLGYIRFIDKKLKMKLTELLRFDFTYLKDYVKVATPTVLSGLLWGVAQAAQMAVLGHINPTVIAANSIAIVIGQIFAVVGWASVNVSSVIIGKTIGEGRLHMVRSYSKTLQGLYLIIGLFFAALMFVLKDAIVGFYNVSPEAKEMAVSFLTVLCISMIGTCYEYPVESGIIAGGGSTKYPAWVDNLFMYLFTIPSAFLSAFVFKWDPVVTFCFLKADQLLKCIPNGITVNRYRWVKILTREDAPAAETVPAEG